MKFSRLKLTGFKSFCDVTELHLEPGLTGVVGPNGCGKSNLVEALRWVMGESSYKAMRASGMDEVIFSGSGNRPGRNSAEVTLVLDNVDRTAPAPLNTADILEVTRRIEREQGSVYRVNGREVRARDVQLLFADASTGAHSPALVGQGRIGELMAAKPAQRRVLLEEAAGISGLHSRRHEAELRLRAAEQNLERVDDIIAQIEQQLETLKRQARLATRYRNLSGEIRRAEAALFHLRWVAARVAEKEAEANQGQLIGKLAEATHAEHEAGKALEIAETGLAPLREAEAAAGAALQRLKIEAEQLEAEQRRADARRAELIQRQTQTKADLDRETGLVAEAETSLAAAEEERTDLQAEAEAEQAASDAARTELTETEKAVAGAETAARGADAALADIKASRAQAKRQAEDARTRAERLARQIAEVRAEAEKITSALEADQAIRTHGTTLEAARARSTEAEAATLAAEAESAARQSTLEAARPALADSRLDLNRLESEAATLARVLNVTDGRLWPAIVDILKVDAGFETALGAALGDDLDASGDSGAPLHWAEAGSAAGDPALPDGAEPLGRHVTGSPLLARRLAQIGLVAKADGPALMGQLRPGQRLVTVEGDLWRWDGFVAAADAPTAAAQRLAQRNRLNELDGEIAAAKKHHDTLDAKIEQLTAAREEARATEHAQRTAWRQAQHDISDAQKKLDAAQKALGDLTSRQSALIEAETRLKSSLAEAEAIGADAEAALGGEADETQAAKDSEAAHTALTAARARRDEARLRLGGFESAARLRRTRLDQLARDREAWTRRRDAAKAQIVTLERRAAEIAAESAGLSASPDGFAAKRSALADKIDGAETTARAARDALAVAETGTRSANEAARVAHDGVAKVREALARVEERLKGAIGQRRQIEQLCEETLSIPATKTAETAGLRPEAPLPREDDVERKVDRLRAERERLGGVNLGAEREAVEVKEKLDTMVADREDLIAAIAKLRTGISNLNREGRARLTEAFDVVNAHFKDLFTSLFGGGAAELKFVDSDDPLQAGLEIIARPPGKKPQSMSLLSGGEQALTVLSLVFAVFLTNPAPICVLDEVDAPLDDANVERFCTLLDTMRTRTQTRFLTITHNPITMSRMDRLFGVTMAEKGVSQLVSVDLTTAQAVAEAI